MNYTQLQDEIFHAEEKLTRLKTEQKRLAGSEFIKDAITLSQWEAFAGPSLADFLVRSLNQREYPMTAHEIREIFEASGFDYVDSHILECKPESQQAVNEEMAYIARNENY